MNCYEMNVFELQSYTLERSKRNPKPSGLKHKVLLLTILSQGVSIAHVDCTVAENANRALCDGEGVNGFPTLNIYNNGEKVK